MLEYGVVTARALALKNEGKEDEMAEMLCQFTDSCVNEAMDTIRKMRKVFTVVNHKA